MSFSANLGAGTYYLQIDGTGSGNPATDGYSDYGSLGTFSISGTAPAGGGSPGQATVYSDCNYGGKAIGLPTGSYSLAQMRTLGVSDNDISSLRINPGYDVVLFTDDQLAGSRLTLTGDIACLTGNALGGGTWNDQTTSLLVRSLPGQATVYSDCNYGGKAVNLPEGSYSLAQLGERGVSDNDISSLRVNPGYDVVLFTDDQLAGSRLTLTSDNACLTGNALGSGTWNDQTTSLLVRAVAPVAFSRQLEAEAHSVNSGMVVEACSEGGQDMGYVDQGDYLVWNAINFPTSGSYRLDYRVASGANGGTISADLNGGAVQLGSTSIPATGGWQSWRTVSRTVSVSAGTYNFGIYAQTGGWNLNWVRITKLDGTTAAAAEVAAGALAPTAVLELYPNPVTDRLALAAPTEYASGQIRIHNLVGQQVWQGTHSGQPVDVSALRAGIYVLTLSIPNHSALVQRFSKQ